MNRRLVSAEFLRIIHNRGVVITTVTMTFGIAVLTLVVPELYRIGRQNQAYVGGQQGLQNGTAALAVLGTIAAMVVGSAAGTNDVDNGVFRDLVATGRSRWALFAVRVPGALVYWLPLITVSFVAMAILDIWFSFHGAVSSCNGPNCALGAGTVPPVSQFVDWYLWTLLFTCFVLVVALGLSASMGSRAITLGVLIPFQLLLAPLLSQVNQLAGVRQALYPQSIGLIMPMTAESRGQSGGIFGERITTSLPMAWLVLAAWVVVVLGLGAWRTARRDA
jgi:ABC-type transport system involved in multi-copper enzyme maturation permease subunit